MKETTLTTELAKTLRQLPGAVVFKHADRITFGIPDISVTWNNMTTWLEVKHANPRIIDTGIQELTLKRMWEVGRNAFYVIYREDPQSTYIVSPNYLRQWDTLASHVPGFDHQAVKYFIRERHTILAPTLKERMEVTSTKQEESNGDHDGKK